MSAARKSGLLSVPGTGPVAFQELTFRPFARKTDCATRARSQARTWLAESGPSLLARPRMSTFEPGLIVLAKASILANSPGAQLTELTLNLKRVPFGLAAGSSLQSLGTIPHCKGLPAQAI